MSEENFIKILKIITLLSVFIVAGFLFFNYSIKELVGFVVLAFLALIFSIVISNIKNKNRGNDLDEK